MKRRFVFSIGLGLVVLLVVLTTLKFSAEAQPQTRYSATTGLVTPGTDQNLSVTVAAGDVNGDGRVDANDTAVVRFRRTIYMRTGCDAGVCRYVVESETTTPPITLGADEAASAMVMGNSIGTDRAGSITVVSNSRNVRVTSQLIDALTGQVDSLMALLLP
jgi:hypothetical protein